MMRSCFVWTTLFLVLAGFSAIAVADSGPNALDCRRFVFAPACRGATIKRSSVPLSANHQAATSLLYPIEENNSVDTTDYEMMAAAALKHPPPPVWLWMDRPRYMKHKRPTHQQQPNEEGEE